MCPALNQLLTPNLLWVQSIRVVYGIPNRCLHTLDLGRGVGMLGNYRLPVDSLVVQLVEVRQNLELVKVMLWVGCLWMLHHPAHLVVILRLWLLRLARRALVIFLGMALPARRAPVVEIHSLLALAVI